MSRFRQGFDRLNFGLHFVSLEVKPMPVNGKSTEILTYFTLTSPQQRETLQTFQPVLCHCKVGGIQINSVYLPSILILLLCQIHCSHCSKCNIYSSKKQMVKWWGLTLKDGLPRNWDQTEPRQMGFVYFIFNIHTDTLINEWLPLQK